MADKTYGTKTVKAFTNPQGLPDPSVDNDRWRKGKLKGANPNNPEHKTDAGMDQQVQFVREGNRIKVLPI